VVYLYMALFTGFIGFLIGNKKGYGLQGFIAGALLSVIGWIWVATLKPRWRCPECGGAVEQGYAKCKNCGAAITPQQSGAQEAGIISTDPSKPGLPQKKNSPIKSVLVVIIIVGFFYVLFLALKPYLSETTDHAGRSSSSTITMNQYLQIRDGAFYHEVVGIVGRPGEEQSRNKIDAIPGVMEAVETVMYQWTNKDGTGMNAIFQNNKLVQKAQYGLE